MLLRNEVRLLTLTGAGGSGKTRLAVDAASEAEQDFAGGVYFVARLGDRCECCRTRDRMRPRAATHRGRPLVEALQDHARTWVHANLRCSFSITSSSSSAAAPLLVALLDGCAALKILVTSRAVLHVSGEFSYTVPPLGVPGQSDRASIDDLSRSPAVRLFVQRAAAIERTFVE